MLMKNTCRVVSAAFTVGLLAGIAGPAAAAGGTASSDNVETMVRKTVLQTGNANGEVSDMSMYTQLSSGGKGSATIEVPVGDASVRNLNGFSSLETTGDTTTFNIDVDGTTTRRVYTKVDSQPIDVVVSATLDGRPVDPNAVINKTGVLKVTYEVVNTTTRPVKTSYLNGAGNSVPLSVTTADPFVGTLAVTLPSEFAEVTATGATAVGDGKGGTQLGYQMVLFEPLGTTTQTLTYEARIASGTLPEATFGFLPIVPYDNSTIATTKSSYASGAESGRKIYSAGDLLGENLLKLQSGIGQLVAGLGQLADGANTIGKGIERKAIPGAEKLAAGAGKLERGLRDKALPGAMDLAKGSKKLSRALDKEIVPGAKDIAAGLVTVDNAFRDLPTTVKSEAKYQQLVGGVNALQIALANLADFQGPVLRSFAKEVDGYLLSIEGLAGGLDCTGAPTATCADVKGYIEDDAKSGKSANKNVITGITGIIDNANTGTDGLKDVKEGIGTLVDTISENLYDNDDWKELVTGGQDLADGLAGDVAKGATDIAVGNIELRKGLIKPIKGAGDLADGGTKLAKGLEPAAAGAKLLTEKLGEAQDGAVQAEDGAGRLKTEGADQLLESGDEAAVEFATKVALLDALQADGEAGAGIPFGKAVGPNTATTGAYQLVLSPAEDPLANDTARYVLGLVAFLAAGLLGTMLWRRRTTL
jgi:putative membrane protein